MGPSPRIRRGGYLAWRHHINIGILGTSPPLGSPIRCFPEGPQMLISVFNCIPHDWQLYCSTHPCPGLHTLGGLAQVSQSILIRRLGWAQQEGGAIWLLNLTVRQATYIATESSRAYRADHHSLFHIDAFPTPPPPNFRSALSAFPDTLQRLWRIPWENSQKEAFWRLAVDGFTMCGNSHIRHFDVVRCECLPLDTPPYSPRRHHFWDCQITQSLVRVLSTNLRMPLLRHQLWLAITPASCMGRVWDVVCMAAVSAIKDGWVLISTIHPDRPRCTVPFAKAKVIASFWSRLSSFASLGKNALAQWCDVPTTHPFLAWRDGTLTVHQI